MLPSLSRTVTTSRCKLAFTLSVLALAAMLSTPTYFVASEVTANLNVESAVSEAAPSSVPTATAEFVVPSVTTHLPSFTANFVTVPSGILISPVFAPLEIVTSNSFA